MQVIVDMKERVYYQLLHLVEAPHIPRGKGRRGVDLYVFERESWFEFVCV